MQNVNVNRSHVDIWPWETQTCCKHHAQGGVEAEVRRIVKHVCPTCSQSFASYEDWQCDRWTSWNCMVAATRTYERTGWKSTRPKTREPKKLPAKKPRWKRKAQQRKSVAFIRSCLLCGVCSRTVDFAWRQWQAGPVVPAIWRSKSIWARCWGIWAFRSFLNARKRTTHETCSAECFRASSAPRLSRLMTPCEPRSLRQCRLGERTRGIAIISLADCQSRDLSKVPNQTSNDRSMRRASQWLCGSRMKVHLEVYAQSSLRRTGRGDSKTKGAAVFPCHFFDSLNLKCA